MLINKTSAQTLRKLEDVSAPLAQLSVTAAEIMKGVDTLVMAERRGLTAEIKQGVDKIIDSGRS